MRKLSKSIFVAAALLTWGVAGSAVAQEVALVAFPVDGPYRLTDTFGDCRGEDCSRLHEGADIMADKLTPVVAAADGFVTVVRGLDPSGAPLPWGHQWLVVEHEGFQTRYLHLNNDTEGTDDGQGMGIAPDVVSAWVAAAGSPLAHPVKAGQLLGWVGDSGNAEESGSHLHFELRVGEGWEAVPVDPYPYLVAADPSGGNPWNGYFSDDDGNVHEGDIDILAADGTTRGCNPPDNTMYCPERHITRGEISAFIRRTLQLAPAPQDYFGDDSASVFEEDINAVTAAGIGFGCDDARFCPDEPLARDEMAEMLVRAFAGEHPDRYTNPEGVDFFTDDDGNRFEESIDLLMAAGVTKGCNPPDNDRYCPQRPLIRGEMASFFVRALGR